jgi:hypothetical protein
MAGVVQPDSVKLASSISELEVRVGRVQLPGESLIDRMFQLESLCDRLKERMDGCFALLGLEPRPTQDMLQGWVEQLEVEIGLSPDDTGASLLARVEAVEVEVNA